MPAVMIKPRFSHWQQACSQSLPVAFCALALVMATPAEAPRDVRSAVATRQKGHAQAVWASAAMKQAQEPTSISRVRRNAGMCKMLGTGLDEAHIRSFIDW